MADTPGTYADDDPVVIQYEKWAYPAAITDLSDPANSEAIASFRSLGNLIPLYWPGGQPRPDLDILVAGCGTIAAASYAYLYPQSRVVGVDISRTSLAHQQRLKDKHQLGNLTLHRLPVEQIATLGLTFDYISAHGVLHHLPDPTAGLTALAGVLRTDGVVAMMLYGRYGRSHLERMQEFFRRMKLGQSADDLALVRQTLAALPDDPQNQHLLRSPDMRFDAGVVDLLLHRRERSYTVEDCLKLTADAGLVFQRWDQNFYYYPDGPFASAPQVRQRLEHLPDPEIWQAMELAVGGISAHYFVACRKERDPKSYIPPWGSTALLNCIPMRAAQLGRRTEGSAEHFAMMLQPFPPVPLTQLHAAILSRIDGRRTVDQCLTESGVTGSPESRLQAADEFFKLLYRTGFGILKL